MVESFCIVFSTEHQKTISGNANYSHHDCQNVNEKTRSLELFELALLLLLLATTLVLLQF